MPRKIRECLKFGAQVRALRQSVGLSQEKLGFRAGIHPVSVSRIERAEINATVSTIYRLAKALRVHPSKFFKS
jgi:transcriptional regulator with XRE-family HTH domain